uniref:Ig-like domain-containing protein n=1 Tax=Gasterosteus aculeatus aculeatus TaxID=481459 RepID=A0AAQ4QBW1_GASAC
MILFYLLLVLRAGRCTDDLIFETKPVGQSVSLTCPRNVSLTGGTLFWMRLVSGNLDTISHITTKQGPGTFLLHIHQAKRSDTGVYYCLEINTLTVTLKKSTFLIIEGPEADVPVITKSAPADPVRPGDSVTLKCSVLSVSEETECPEGQKVFWFKAGSDRSPPHVIYVHGNRDGCEQSPEAPPPHRCVYSFSKNISSSDAGTYYCAAATCGQMLLGEGTTLETEGTDKSLIPILSAGGFIEKMMLLMFQYAVKYRDQDLLTYSAPTFTARKTVRAERENAEAAAETVYAGVRT